MRSTRHPPCLNLRNSVDNDAVLIGLIPYCRSRSVETDDPPHQPTTHCRYCSLRASSDLLESFEKCEYGEPILGGAFGIAILPKRRGTVNTRNPWHKEDSILLVRGGIENGPSCFLFLGVLG